MLLAIAATLRTTATTAQVSTPSTNPPVVVQATLTAAGSPAFHLKAVVTEQGDPGPKSEVEIFWKAPNEWRRTIESPGDFSQTLIVAGDKVFEQDSGDYFPLWLRTLASVIVDPKPVLDAFRPGDIVLTKANGASDESGKSCFPDRPKLCMTHPFGLWEQVAAAGHSVDFTNYQSFHGKRVARLLIYNMSVGDSYRVRVTELSDLKKSDPKLFLIPQPTPPNQQLRSATVAEEELRSQALQPLEIVWPQVLDGATTGKTSYYVCVDRSGNVREVLPLSVAVERADRPAERQIAGWKFKPVLRDGVPVQAETIMNFDFNTRAYGPAAPLMDAEVRKLASGIVEPIYPPGTPSGTALTLNVAVDSDGTLIEIIPGDGARDLVSPCMEAIRKWHFSPMLENSTPRPYRAHVTFRVP
ncbi:MAG TPA: hypothetical protein VJW93_05300 [Candidatus Acidoferrales bacterium]|nr:hypothetical protein [Candidatus Acidoferrales bacterium]